MVDLSKKEDSVTARKMYAIYAGIGGDFGGRYFRYFDSYESEDDALEDAREIAIEEYESYEEGSHGVLSKKECEEACIDYDEEVEGLIDYSAKEVSYEDIISIGEEEGLDLVIVCKALTRLSKLNKINKTMEAK